MADSAYGTPLVLNEGRPPVRMTRVSINARGEGGDYDERFIQRLAFDHPDCLPISEVDIAYEGLVAGLHGAFDASRTDGCAVCHANRAAVDPGSETLAKSGGPSKGGRPVLRLRQS